MKELISLTDLKCPVILVILNNTSKISRQIICESCHVIDIVFIKWFTEPTSKMKINLPFNSHEWPRENFSLQDQYNVNQLADETKEKYKFEDN